MTILLRSEEGRELSVNYWNWGVLHYLVAEARVLPEEVWAPKRTNAGGSVDPSQAASLASFLEREVLPRLKPGERMFLDGSVTAVPDDGTLWRGDLDWKNYSLGREVLRGVIDLLRAARNHVEFL